MRTKKDNIQNRDSQSKLLQRFDGLENNNPPTNNLDGKKTGILYTSDWIDKLSYPEPGYLENRYKEPLVFLDKLVRKGEWLYSIDLLFRNPIPPDYGESIVNVNDFFVIKKEIPDQCVITNECTPYNVDTVSQSYNSIKVANWFADEDPCIFFIKIDVPIQVGDKIDLRGTAIGGGPLLSLTLSDITTTPGPYFISEIIEITTEFTIVRITNSSGEEVCYDVPLPEEYFFNSTSVVKFTTTVTVPSTFNLYVGDQVNLTFSECPLIPVDIYIGSITIDESTKIITFVDENNNPLNVECSGTLCVERNSCETCQIAESLRLACFAGSRTSYFGFPVDAVSGETTIWSSTDMSEFVGYEITSLFFVEETDTFGPYIIQSVTGPILVGETPIWEITVKSGNGTIVTYDGSPHVGTWGFCVRNCTSFTLDDAIRDGEISHIWMNGLMNPDIFELIANLDGSYSFRDVDGGYLYVPLEGGTVCSIISPTSSAVTNNDVRGYVKEITIEEGEGDDYIIKRHNLLCVVTEGDPYRVDVGDMFIWSRDEFRTDTNPRAVEPIKLEALKILSNNATLTWVDPTQLGKSFAVKIRKDGLHAAGDIYYSDTLGLTITESTFIVDFVVWGLTPGNYQWSVSTIYDDEKKEFSMWSEESLLIIR